MVMIKKPKVLKQRLLKIVGKRKQQSTPEEYISARKALSGYLEFQNKFSKQAKHFSQKTESGSKYLYDMGELLINNALSFGGESTEVLLKIGEALKNIAEMQHSLLVNIVDKVIIPSKQAVSDIKEGNTLHKKYEKACCVYDAAEESVLSLHGKQLTQKKVEESIDFLHESKIAKDKAFNDSHKMNAKLAYDQSHDSGILHMFDYFYHYYKDALEQIEEVRPNLELLKNMTSNDPFEEPKKISLTEHVDIDKIEIELMSQVPNLEGEVPSLPSQSTVSRRSQSDTSSEPTKKKMRSPSIKKELAPQPIVEVKKAEVKVRETFVAKKEPPIHKPISKSTPNPKFLSVAMYDYEAAESTEINIKAGEYIFVTEYDPEGWGKGTTMEGSSGEFPANYLDSERMYKPSVTKILYDYAASEPGELDLSVGDSISVYLQEGDWWIGATNGKTGIFPSNYCALGAE